MARALILQHMDHDHAGRFLDYFAEDGIIPETVRLWKGEAIPGLSPFDLMFVLGGAQDTWQESEYPWLAGEKQAIREWALTRARPYIGVCLGHQLLCDALGGIVADASEAEVGVAEIVLTDEGRAHPLCKGLSPRHQVMQWHQAEVTRAPEGATVLASSSVSAIQAVAVGGHAVGTQFHCEFTPQTIAGWASLPDYIANLERHRGQGAYPRLVAEAYPLMPQMAAMTRKLYDNLIESTGLRRQARRG